MNARSHSAYPMRRLVVLSAFFVGLASTTVGAQANSAAGSPRDSIFRRARRLVADGNGTAGRALVDSLLRQSTEGTTPFGDALYWRGALAETAADAERDYRRVIVEYPVSLYADDALLALVELEQARGDRAGALQHLQRFVREHQVSNPARGVAALAAARLAFDQRDTKTGCSMITEARASVSATDVEMRNQIDYFGTRCTADVATTPPPGIPARDTIAIAHKKTAAPSTASRPMPAIKVPDKPAPQVVTKAAEKTPQKAPDKPKLDSVPEKAPDAPQPKAPVAPRGRYTIQLAAYSTQFDAERLIAKLAKSGVAARVSGTSKPFRVRLDFFPTRQAAQDEVVSLKKRGIIGFVTTEEPPAEAKAP